MGKGEREDSNERRRQVTFHSFRRFVKTTISDLGYADYSEYFIGHSVSTYWRKKESEKAETIQENRALSHIFKHTPIGKAGCRYPEQGK